MNQDLNDKIPAYDENMNMEDFNVDNFNYQQQGYDGEMEQPLGPMAAMMGNELHTSTHSQAQSRNRSMHEELNESMHPDDITQMQQFEDEMHGTNKDKQTKKKKAVIKKKKIGSKTVDSKVINKTIELTNQEIKKYLDDTSGICRVSDRQARKAGNTNVELNLKHPENYFQDVYENRYRSQEEVDATWSKRGGNIPGNFVVMKGLFE